MAESRPSNGDGQHYIMQGWMLKKKKKKMQGMARRYFRLSSDGMLSYSFNPQSATRDSLEVPTAFVSASARHRSLHLDSGKTVYHCKALTTADFEAWTRCIKQFISSVMEDDALLEEKGPSAGGSLSNSLNGGDSSKGALLDMVLKLGAPIEDLDAILGELRNLDAAQHTPSPHSSAQPSPSKAGSAFKFLGTRRASSARPEQFSPPVGAQAPSPAGSQQHLAVGHPHQPVRRGSHSSSLDPATGASADYFDSKTTLDSIVRMYAHTLASLKQQQNAIAQAARELQQQQYDQQQQQQQTGPLGLQSYASRSSAHYKRHTPSRASSFSIASGETEWEDALAGEFVMEDDSASDDDDDARAEGRQLSPPPEEATEEEDEDEDDPSDSSFTSADQHQLGDASGSTSAKMSPSSSQQAMARAGVGLDVERRKQLPHPIAGDEISMLGLLRKNVGKDLSTISFPVTMNEPISAIQRICEELEYAPNLLDRAAKSEDPLERLTLVTTFAISSHSGNKYRSTRKPFNPLLGETFECIRPDKGFRFIGEKVSHHPPILAFHAEASGAQAQWQIDGHLSPSQKFWGRSMEILVAGDYKIAFPDTGDVFMVTKPSNWIKNLVAGTKYLEVAGDLVVLNERTGDKATIHFKEGSSWGGASTRNKLEGRVCDAHGATRAELVGRWDEAVDRKQSSHSFERLWTIDDFPAHAERFYGFSKFAVELNELSSIEHGHLPPTDSRLRPDQRALELGDVASAERDKTRVEDAQRARRREGKVAPPAWFKEKGGKWEYTGRYFDAREKAQWPDAAIF